ncbi:MAG: hypothetical protein ACE1ZM_06745 [Gammaproteobacteria bacterium]|jgi:hypothetical protein
MKYESIKHSFLIILIATTIVGCAGNSVQSPASQYQTSSESFDSRGDTSSIDGDEGGWPTEMEYSMGAKIINTAALIVLAPPLFALALIAGGVH